MKNPPAYPGTYFVDRHSNLVDPSSDASARALYNSGMTLLDYFAGQAMQGTLANSDRVLAAAQIAMEDGVKSSAVVASVAYEYARAMLAEREKPENNINS